MSIVLQRLAALRRRREKQALEVLSVQAGLLQRTAQKAEETAQAVRDHVHHSRVRERELIGALGERSVSQAAIVRIQMELDRAALDTAQLRAAAARAQADMSTSQRARAEAHAKFRTRQRATAKIEFARRQKTMRLLRWDAALSDVEGEDHRAASITSQLP